MAKYFVPPLDPGERQIAVTGELAHHLGQVLRVQLGARLRFSDGESREYEGTVVSVEKGRVLADIIASGPLSGEPPLRLLLLQGIAKGERMDFMVHKGVELGVAEILPLETAFTVVKTKGKEEEKRQRWQKIAAAAAEQCGRGRIPKVRRPLSLAQALDDIAGARLVFCWEKEGRGSLEQALKGHHGEDIALLIGPEGGFSGEEAAEILARGGHGVRLGPRILRTETAAVAALAAICYALGSWEQHHEKGQLYFCHFGLQGRKSV